MQTTSQQVPTAETAENPSAPTENDVGNSAKQRTPQAIPASKNRRTNVHADNAGFSSEIFVKVMEKCFSKDNVHAVVDKCVEAEKQAFQILERTRAKPRAERLRLLSTCRPIGCETVADLFRWLVQVISCKVNCFFALFSATSTINPGVGCIFDRTKLSRMLT